MAKDAHGSDRYKYVVYNAGERYEWLNDMQQAPGEMTSLVDSAEHEDILKAHRSYHAKWGELTKDPFLDNEWKQEPKEK